MVCQQNHGNLALRVNPHRRPGEAGVPVAAGRKKVTGQTPLFRRSIPPQCPLASGRHLLAGSEILDGGSLEVTASAVKSSVYHHLCIVDQIGSRGKESSVPGDASQLPRPFIVYDSVNETALVSLINFRRSNPR